MEIKNFKVFNLQGDTEAVRRIGTSAGLSSKTIDAMVKVSEGNPGAMNYLVDICKQSNESRIECLCACLEIKKLKGSELYSYIKMHTVSGAIHKFIEAGWL